MSAATSPVEYVESTRTAGGSLWNDNFEGWIIEQCRQEHWSTVYFCSRPVVPEVERERTVGTPSLGAAISSDHEEVMDKRSFRNSVGGLPVLPVILDVLDVMAVARRTC